MKTPKISVFERFIAAPVGLTKPAAALFTAVMLLTGLAREASAQSYSLTPNWQVLATDNTNGLPTANIGTGNNERSLAYNAASNHVILASRSGGNGAYAFDAATGLYVTNLNMTGVSGGSVFSWNAIAASDDGRVFGFNASQTTFKIYIWTNYNDAPYVGFLGDPSSGLLSSFRAGDAVTLRGTGPDTQILVSSGATGTRTNAFLFSTANGFDFTPTLISVPGVPNDTFRFGMAFYTNNTFLAKQNGQPLYLIQYPADATSSQSVTGTVLATASFPAGNDPHLVAYNPDAKILGGVTATAPAKQILYNLSSFSSPVPMSTNLFATSTANGNLAGAIFFGGAGKTNDLFTLWCNNGILASHITYNTAVVPPVIGTQPVGATIYTNTPAFTLTVGASGSSPLYYQWRFNSNNIAGATNGSYALNFPSTSASGAYDVIVSNSAGSVISTQAVVTVLQPTTSSVVTQLWNLAVNSRPYVDNNYGTRGLAYDPITSTVLLSSRATTNIYVLNANTGADMFQLNTLGIGIGTFALNMVGVADDGVVYAGNLAVTASGNPLYLYSWSTVAAEAIPNYAYPGGDPNPGSGERWGDTLAVRGAGVDTQILMSSLGSNNVALFTTTDGQNFTPTIIHVADAPNGFANLGLAFGAGNTFWAKNLGSSLRQISFDPVAGTGSTVQNYVAPNQLPTGMTGIGMDVTNNILAGVVINDNPHDLRLYQLSGDTNAPYLFHQTFFPSLNANVQGNATVAIKNGHVYALEPNNGIVAMTYGTPPPPSLPPYSISAVAAQAGSQVVLTWQSVAGHSYQVQYKTSLTDASWTNAGSPVVATGSTTSFTNDVTSIQTRFFRVQSQ